MIKTVSIDMSTCAEDFDNRIFGRVLDQVGDNLICEFDSANYDFKQEKVIEQLKEKLNIAVKTLNSSLNAINIENFTLKVDNFQIMRLRNLIEQALKEMKNEIL